MYRITTRSVAPSEVIDSFNVEMATTRLMGNELLQNQMTGMKYRDTWCNARAFNQWLSHVTYCDKATKYELNKLMKHKPYRKYFNELSPTQQAYIRDTMDGKLCIIPLWILLLHKDNETAAQRKNYVVSILFTILLYFFFKSKHYLLSDYKDSPCKA